MTDEHCYECAGKGAARGYTCFTCDGKGNLKVKEQPKKLLTRKGK